MPITITRTAWIDDDGTATVGTVVNNAEKTTLYNQIDAALALLLPLTGGTLTGGLLGTTAEFSGTLGVTGASTLAALSATTGAFSGAVTVASTFSVTGAITANANSVINGTGSSNTQLSINSTTTNTSGMTFGNATTGILVQFEATNAKGMGFLVNGGNAYGLELSSTGAWRGRAYGAGTATFDASGNITSASDERMKDIEGPFAPGLKAVLSIKPILYRWKKETGLDLDNVYAGFSAQNVLGAVPEAIGKQNGRYSLNIVPVLAAVVNAIQELAKEADELRAKTGLAAVTRTMPVNTSEARIVDSARVKRVA